MSSDGDDDSVSKQWSSVRFLAQESEECRPHHGAYACGPPVRDDTSVTSVTSHPEDTTLREDDEDNPAVVKSSRHSSNKNKHSDDDDDDDDDDSLAEQWTRVRRESEHRRRNNNHCDACHDETSVTSFTSNHGNEQEEVHERLVPPALQALVDSGVISFPSDLEQGTAANSNLVVARPVQPTGDDVSPEYPAAVEYDPDAKRTTTKSPKWLYVAWACCAAVLVAVAIAVGMVVSNNDDDDALHPREQIGIRQEILKNIVQDETVLQNPLSPYTKAMQWITFDDPLQLVPEDDHFLQRYIMAYFYHATTETRPWKVCNPPQDSTERTTCSLKQLIGASSREDFRLRPVPVWGSRWLSEKHECEWAEVECNEANQVESISLGGQGLNGDFPEGIVHLSSLRTLKLLLNEIQGELPTTINAFKSIEWLDLGFNFIAGTIPKELWDLTTLTVLKMNNNEFKGPLSPYVGRLTNLKKMQWGNNKLTGELPKEIGALTKLDSLGLEINFLRGTIPSEVGALSKLEWLVLYDSNLSGTLPSSVAHFSSLESLLLGKNPLLAGEFPPGIWDVERVRIIEIDGCNFSGSIGVGVGNMKNLTSLLLSNNPFSGTVPAEMSQNTKLVSLRIDGTNIQGPMPAQVCERQESSERTSAVFWQDIRADCLGDAPAFECACCTMCCKAGGTDCREVVD